MGIPNYVDYSIVTHARTRILERFNIDDDQLSKWLIKLMKGAVYSKSQTDGRQVWRKNSIELIIEPKTHKVITVYPKDVDTRPIAVKQSLNPEVAVTVKQSLEQLRRKTLRNQAAKLMPLYSQIQKLYAEMKGTTTGKLLENKQQKVVELQNEVTKIQSGYQDILDSVNSVLD